MRKKKTILAERASAYENLEKQLRSLPMLAQGNVFSVPPPAETSKASTRYTWTRKVNNKTVTKALSREQYEALGEAIEANRKVEGILREMREISQEAIMKSLPDSPGKRRAEKKS
jgi:hypothetical protein